MEGEIAYPIAVYSGCYISVQTTFFKFIINIVDFMSSFNRKSISNSTAYTWYVVSMHK